MKRFLMMRDQAVLEIDGYDCRILDYRHLPTALKYEDVNYDDVFFTWAENRTLSVSRTNAKRILSALRLPQVNLRKIGEACHYASLTDCYWLKDEQDPTEWKDVNLFQNRFEESIATTALIGTPVRVMLEGKVRTPELTLSGLSAKCWVRNQNRIWLYKIGKMEAAASEILEALGISHVPYSLCTDQELQGHVDEEHMDRIRKEEERVVKCPCITSEERSIISWEDFAICCDRHGRNPYELVLERWPVDFYQMNTADFILGNSDRHTANYGFFVDNASGEITGYYPLMDHDHAFVNGDLPIQTMEKSGSLREEALKQLKHIKLPYENLIQMDRPEELTEVQWEGVLGRVEECLRASQKKAQH